MSIWNHAKVQRFKQTEWVYQIEHKTIYDYESSADDDLDNFNFENKKE